MKKKLNESKGSESERDFKKRFTVILSTRGDGILNQLSRKNGESRSAVIERLLAAEEARSGSRGDKPR